MNEPERLSGELEELLQAERDIEAPPPEKRARLLSRLGPLLIPGAIGAGVGAAAATASSGAETAATGSAATGKAAGVVGAGLKAKLVIAAIAGAVGAIGGAATHAALTAPEKKPAPSVAASARPLQPAPAAIVSATPSAEAAPSAAAPPAPSTSAPARSSGNGAATLRTERLLLERASTALGRGDSTSALAALREHARKFPHGELAEEREVLLVRALRAAGQNDAAEKRAKDFKREFPSSLQQGIIDATPSSQ